MVYCKFVFACCRYIPVMAACHLPARKSERESDFGKAYGNFVRACSNKLYVFWNKAWSNFCCIAVCERLVFFDWRADIKHYYSAIFGMCYLYMSVKMETNYTVDFIYSIGCHRCNVPDEYC